MIDVNIAGVSGIEVLLSGIDARLQNMTPFWTDYVSPFVYAESDDIFDSQGHGTWADLDPRYAKRKAVTHPGKGILRRDDTYFDAATGPNAPGSFLQVSPLELVIGVDGGYFEAQFGVNYPALHEGGNPKTNLSQRSVYGLIPRGERFEERLGQLAEKWQKEEIQILERSLRG